MQTVSAMFIESAIDEQNSQPQDLRDAQRREVAEAIGANVAQQLGVTFPLTDEAKTMFELGINSARVVLLLNVELRQKGIDPTTLL